MKKANNIALNIAREYFRAWNSKNFEKAADLLSDAASFDMPINHYDRKEAFVQALEFTANAASEVNLLAEFGDDQEAILLYEFNFEPVGKFRIAEHFKIENDKIVLIRHIHDTHALRQAGFGNE